ncbi:MAG: nitrilase-related carbon-nitrogen hydrolase [Pirellulales bacterium]
MTATTSGAPAVVRTPGKVRVALAQIAPALGDLPRNLELHEQQLAAARDLGADLVVFPELSLTGYYLRDIVPEVARPLDAPEIRRLAAAAGDLAVVFGFVEQDRHHRFFNSAALIERGEVRHVHRKVYLPTYGLFDEQRYFAAGHRVQACQSPLLGRVGLVVCEDFWHLSVATILQADDIDWLICIANSPARGVATAEVRTATTYRCISQTYAQLLGAVVVLCNRAGVEEGLCFWGGSLVAGPSGEVLGSAPPLDPQLTCIDVDPGEIRRARIGTPLARDERLLLTIEELQRVRRRQYADPADSPELREGPRP